MRTGATGIVVLWMQRPLLHDHLPRTRRRGPRNVRFARAQSAGAGRRGRLQRRSPGSARKPIQHSVRASRVERARRPGSAKLQRVLWRFLVERAADLDILSAAASAAREGAARSSPSGRAGYRKNPARRRGGSPRSLYGDARRLGSSLEAGGAPAFWPWVQTYRALSRAGFDLPSELSRDSPEHASAEPPQALGADRFALFDAVLLNTCRRRRAAAIVPRPRRSPRRRRAVAGTRRHARACARRPPRRTGRDVQRCRGEVGPASEATSWRVSRVGQALRPTRLSRAAVAELATALAERDRAAPAFPRRRRRCFPRERRQPTLRRSFP